MSKTGKDPSSRSKKKEKKRKCLRARTAVKKLLLLFSKYISP